jgi:hypothetical protein
MNKPALLGFGVVLLVSLRLTAEPPVLAGIWRPDAAASKVEKVLKTQPDSTLGTAPPPPPAKGPIHPTERIEQSGNRVVITSLDEEGQVVSVIALMPEGQETLNPLAGGQVIHKSRARWVDAALHVEWSLERNGQRFLRGSDVRSLEDAGATQRLERNVEDGKSKSHLMIVLRRSRTAA